MASTRNSGSKSSEHDQIYDHFVRIVESLIGKGETYDQDLLKVGKEMFNKKFAGVFAADTIPKSTNFHYCIANLDNQDEPGSHWVAMAKLPGPKKYLIYDSFGRKTSEILPELDIPHEQTEQDAEQVKSEDNCGARCLAWLIMFDMFGPDIATKI